MKHYFTLFFVFLVSFFACKEPPEYSHVPQIEVLHAEYFLDSSESKGTMVKSANVTFELIDGDGNIGFSNASENTFGNSVSIKDSFDLYMNIYQYLRDSSLRQVHSDTFSIPYTKPYNINEYLKAEIQVHTEYGAHLFPYDTIQVEIWVYDLDFNKSNLAKSGKLILKE